MEEITVFETRDGKRFDTTEAAHEHILGRCRSVVEKELLPLLEMALPCYRRHDIKNVCEVLCDNYDQTGAFIKQLNNVFE